MQYYPICLEGFLGTKAPLRVSVFAWEASNKAMLMVCKLTKRFMWTDAPLSLSLSLLCVWEMGIICCCIGRSTQLALLQVSWVTSTSVNELLQSWGMYRQWREQHLDCRAVVSFGHSGKESMAVENTELDILSLKESMFHNFLYFFNAWNRCQIHLILVCSFWISLASFVRVYF